MARIILFIASSIDGKIAGPGHSLDFLTDFQQSGEDYGTGAFLKRIGVIVLGRTTFDLHLGFNHWDVGKKGYVLTSKPVVIPEGWDVEPYQGELHSLLVTLQKGNQDVWLEGGASILQQALAADKVDEMIITVIPKILGAGIPLFNDSNCASRWSVAGCHTFADGVVQLHYVKA